MESTNDSPGDAVLYLSGPTGSGKSAIALALASRLRNAAIINADAFQLYRGYEILSAAPTADDLRKAPHHLYGILDLSDNCDAARYAELARPVIEAQSSQGILPIVTGGSGLYLKALTHGLAPTPPADPDLRSQLEALSIDDLVDWYQKLDPEGAAKTNLKNRRYVTRSLEISLLTGTPASVVKNEFAIPDPAINAIFVTRNREDLYDRINRRTRAMFRDGVVHEIRRLENRPLSITAEKAIGLREIRAVLTGELDQKTAIEQIQQATRRYAKRQMTWFRREKAFQSVCLAPEETPDSAAERILQQFPHLASSSS